jgi:hypothetical protein
MTPFPADWQSRPAADAAEIAHVEARLGLQLPAEYRALLLVSNGGSLVGPSDTVTLESVGELPVIARQEEYHRLIPGMLVIGDNGSGAVYFFDPHNALRRGAWALYWVQLGLLSLGTARFAGASLAELFSRIASGVLFFEEPAIG